MTDATTAIAELHCWFCERTGLQTKLIFSQRLWFEMARAYDCDFEKLRADVDLIVRYLKREIARDKRNLGALKLINFLQPDNFDADLAIAKLAFTQRSRKTREDLTTTDCIGVEARADEQTRGKIAQELRTFRKSMQS